MKKYTQKSQQRLARWAADCAEKVLPFFEQVYPTDDRPRKAVETCREWADTGIFKMAVIRKASLDAHAAARKAKKIKSACYAARAAGHAVATAHVSQHSFGSIYYALKALAVSDPNTSEKNIANELKRMVRKVPVKLRKEILKRISIENQKKGLSIKLTKNEDF